MYIGPFLSDDTKVDQSYANQNGALRSCQGEQQLSDVKKGKPYVRYLRQKANMYLECWPGSRFFARSLGAPYITARHYISFFFFFFYIELHLCDCPAGSI